MMHQALADHPQAVRGKKEHRRIQHGSQIDDESAFVNGGHQAAGAFDHDDIADRFDPLQRSPDRFKVDGFISLGDSRGGRQGKLYRNDVIQGDAGEVRIELSALVMETAAIERFCRYARFDRFDGTDAQAPSGKMFQ